MAKDALTISIGIDGLRPTLRAVSHLPKDASDELRDASLKLSKLLAVAVKADGMGDAAPQSPLVATTVRAQKDRVPVIVAGGNKRLGRNRAPAYKLLFGSIFGSNQYSQFRRPHGGNDAYWFFPVIDKHEGEIGAEWLRVADNVIRKFGQGG